MKNNPTLVAVICGLLAAVLFLGAFSFGAIGLVLSNFTAFPLFVAVLGFGTRAGAIAAIIAGAAVAVFTGVYGALGLTVTTIGPALWIGHMVGLSRYDSGTAEWFPVPSLLFRIALLCAAIAIVIGWMAGFSIQMATGYFTETMTKIVEFHATTNNAAVLFSPEEIVQRAGLMARLTPVLVPAWLLLLLCYNLSLAARFTRKQGWMLRPKDDLPQVIALPAVATTIMGGAVAASFLPAPVGLWASTIAGSFGAAFVMVGLATVHFLSRNIAGRKLLLVLLYVALILMPGFVPPLMALLGIAETLLHLRVRYTSSPPPPLGPPPSGPPPPEPPPQGPAN